MTALPYLAALAAGALAGAVIDGGRGALAGALITSAIASLIIFAVEAADVVRGRR